MRSTSWQIQSFAIIGGIGFLIDGGIMTLLHDGYDIELLSARLVSFSAAVTTTWFLNRQRTFADRKELRVIREWGRYAMVNGAGALVNLGIFFWLIDNFSVLANTPLLPLAIAASIALALNFFASKHIAFRHPQT